MHKNTKLTSILRREIYSKYYQGGHSFRSLGKEYHVDKGIIKKVIIRGRVGNFTIHDSTNHRFKTITYGLKRLVKTEALIAKRLARIRIRYERTIPGELIHSDNRRLPYLLGEGEPKKIKREVLFVAIDDYSRYLFADILPDRTQ